MTQRRPARGPIRVVLVSLAGAYAVGLVVLSAVHVFAPQRNGLLALTQVFAPHLFLPLVVFMPLAFWLGSRVAGVLTALALIVGLVRFGPGMVTLPVTPNADSVTVRVLTWNLAAGEGAAEILVDRVLSSDVEVVALQELRPEHVAVIQADERVLARFPGRVLNPNTTTHGIGLMTRFPLVETLSRQRPPMIVAEVAVNRAGPLTVVTAHPRAPRVDLLGGLVPISYGASSRDHALDTIRAELDAHANGPLIVLGDFNVTDRELGYGDLAGGLIDAHRAVGVGPGSTWRPATIDALPLAVLRIDYIFTSGGARPLSLGVECIPNAGDHCLVEAVVELPAAAP